MSRQGLPWSLLWSRAPHQVLRRLVICRQAALQGCPEMRQHLLAPAPRLPTQRRMEALQQAILKASRLASRVAVATRRCWYLRCRTRPDRWMRASWARASESSRCARCVGQQHSMRFLLSVKQASHLATAKSMAVRKPQVADAGELGLAQEQLRRLQAARASGGQSAGMAAELALWREHLAARQDTKLGAGLPAPSACVAEVLPL